MYECDRGHQTFGTGKRFICCPKEFTAGVNDRRVCGLPAEKVEWHGGD